MQIEVVEPGRVVALRMVESGRGRGPSGTPCGPGRTRAAISAQSRMKVTSAQRISSCAVRAPISAMSACIRSKASRASDSRAPDFGGADVVVHEAAQLVLDLGLRRAVRVAQRAVDQLVRLAQLIGGQLALVRGYWDASAPARSPKTNAPIM